jgi:Txe/YoeB family toxin of Txe-Axe toxin-antitoxin module
MNKLEVLFTQIGAEEFDYWKEHNLKIYNKIVKMINYIANNYPPKMYHPNR